MNYSSQSARTANSEQTNLAPVFGPLGVCFFEITRRIMPFMPSGTTYASISEGGRLVRLTSPFAQQKLIRRAPFRFFMPVIRVGVSYALYQVLKKNRNLRGEIIWVTPIKEMEKIRELKGKE